MLFVLLPLAVIAAVSTGVSIGVRRASDDPDRWHVDPTTAEPTGNPNWYRLTPDAAPADRNSERDGSSPLFDTDVATLSATFDAVALGDDRVEVLAGAAADGFVTYVQRSALFGFPDYVSVTFGAADGGGSTLAIYSRARYGKSDLGVNQKRVTRWVDATVAALG